MNYSRNLENPEDKGPETIHKNVGAVWIISTFLISYLLNLATTSSEIFWMPDFMALTLIYWTVHQPRHVGMSMAFVCGLLMDVHAGSVLGQQALAYVILSYAAYIMHRRLAWFGLIGQALHILPVLLLSQVVVLLIRLWFDGLWCGFPWFLQSITGAVIWPLVSLALSYPERRRASRELL